MSALMRGSRYTINQVRGIFEIICISTETYEYNNGNGKWHTRNKLIVRCLLCGAVQSLTHDAIYRCARNGRTTCDVCAPRTAVARERRSLGGCPQCSDLPWRRPENHPCRCGKHYEPERIEIEICRGQSSLAACQNGIGVAYI